VKSKDFYYNSSWVKEYTFEDKMMTYGSGNSIRLRNVFKYDGQVLTTSNANTNFIGKKVSDEDLKITHTATFPRELPLIGILSSTKPGDVVLDCFNGLATTGEVALELDRNYIGFDLNEEYLKVSASRLRKTVEEIEKSEEKEIEYFKLVA
jgi:DNA modification methylase